MTNGWIVAVSSVGSTLFLPPFISDPPCFVPPLQSLLYHSKKTLTLQISLILFLRKFQTSLSKGVVVYQK